MLQEEDVCAAFSNIYGIHVWYVSRYIMCFKSIGVFYILIYEQ